MLEKINPAKAGIILCFSVADDFSRNLEIKYDYRVIKGLEIFGL